MHFVHHFWALSFCLTNKKEALISLSLITLGCKVVYLSYSKQMVRTFIIE